MVAGPAAAVGLVEQPRPAADSSAATESQATGESSAGRSAHRDRASPPQELAAPLRTRQRLRRKCGPPRRARGIELRAPIDLRCPLSWKQRRRVSRVFYGPIPFRYRAAKRPSRGSAGIINNGPVIYTCFYLKYSYNATFVTELASTPPQLAIIPINQSLYSLPCRFSVRRLLWLRTKVLRAATPIAQWVWCIYAVCNLDGSWDT